MHTFQTFSLLAIAGSALARPWGEGNYWGGHGGDDHRAMFTFTETATATAFTTVTGNGQFFGFGAPAATPTTTDASTPTPAAASPVYTNFFNQPQAQPQVFSSPAAAASTPTASPDTSSSSSGGFSDYMSTVNEWRSKMGLSQLIHDATLEANAQKTVNDDAAINQMKHELNPGSMAQVLAPGNANNFESVFVGGWLCEVPSTPGLDGICSTMSQGWDYAGQTDHNAILTSHSYSKIGCATSDATSNTYTACDLA